MRTAKIVPIVCAMTSIFVGFVVFSVLGFMAHRLGTTVDKVTAAGEWEIVGGRVFFVACMGICKYKSVC